MQEKSIIKYRYNCFKVYLNNVTINKMFVKWCPTDLLQGKELELYKLADRSKFFFILNRFKCGRLMLMNQLGTIKDNMPIVLVKKYI